MRRFSWYWPFARPEELDWAVGTIRPGEQLIVQVIARPGAPDPGARDGVTVVADLPDVDRGARGPRWLSSRTGTYLRRARARRDLWRRESFDLVHLHYVNRFTDTVTRLPHPLVISVHDVLPHVPRLGRRGERVLLRRLYGRADALVVHHPRLADRLADELGLRGERVHVVPHQVFPVPGPLAPLPAGPPRVLFFGALRRNKGLDTLAGALRLLDDPELRLTIAGRGDPSVERLARSLASSDPRVTAEIGFATLERKRELFSSASLVVLPYSSFESQSGVLHDAYGHGRPVVVTDVGALGDAVRDDGTGVVVPSGDVMALAQAVREATDPVRAREFSVNAQQISLDRAPSAVGAALRRVYDDVLDHR